MRLTNNLKFLGKYGDTKLNKIITLVLLSIIGIFFEALGLGLILPVLDFISANGDTEYLRKNNEFWTITTSTFSQLNLELNLFSLTLLVLIAVVLRQLFDYIYLIKLTLTEVTLQKNLRTKCYSIIQSTRLDIINKMGSGKFINLLDHQTESTSQVLVGYIRYIRHIVTFTVYVTLIIMTAPLSSGLAIFLLGSLLVIIQFYVRKTREVSNQLITYKTILASFLTEAYQAFRTVKIFGLQSRQIKRIKQINEKHARLNLNLVKNSGKIPLIMAPTITAILMAFLYISVTYLDMTINTITLFALIMLRLAPTAQAFAKQQQGLAKHIVSLEALKESIITCTQNPDTSGQRTEVHLKNSICGKSLSYSYNNDSRLALHNINLKLSIGKIVAITGSSGAGKSTLVDILSGLATPTNGHVSFDEKVISKENQESLRDIISYAAQEPFLFRGSVKENIQIGSPSADHNELIKACEMAYANHFIEKLPNGYDTQLDEAGENLSGGQKQRIALARCFLRKSPLLILDEPTSSLDRLSEQKITQSIRQYAQTYNALVIIITHRDTTIEDVDEVIKMENGQIVEHYMLDE